MVLYWQNAYLLREPGTCVQPGIGPGHALSAVLIRCELSHFLELVDRSFRVKRHRAMRVAAPVLAPARVPAPHRTARPVPPPRHVPLRSRAAPQFPTPPM